MAPGTETILIVDDSETIRTPLAAFLELKGYHVIQAGDPMKALAQYHQYGQPIDLLLTDFAMPGMNGCELFRKLAETQPKLRVLFLSGYSEEFISRQEVIPNGAGFMMKPVSMAVLLANIRFLLDGE